MAKGQTAEQNAPKKARSAAQIAAFEKARAARAAKMGGERGEQGALGGETGTQVQAGTSTPQQTATQPNADSGKTRRKGGEGGTGRGQAATATAQQGQTMTKFETNTPLRGISEHMFDEGWMQGSIYLQGLCQQAGALLNQAVISAGQGNYTLAHNYELGALNFLSQARSFTDNRPGRR